MSDTVGKRILTKERGVYMRESSTRRYNGKADVCFDITYKDNSGKKIWEKIGWRSEGISFQLAAKIRRERMETIRVGNSIIKPQRRMTFAMLFEEWSAVHLPTLKNDNKRIVYLAQKHILPDLGARFLYDITPLDIEKLMLKKKNEGLASQTMRHIYSLISRVYRKAVAWNLYTGAVPTDGAKKPKEGARRERYLTQEEAVLLLQTLKKLSALWHDIALLSLHTGLRLGDCLSLRGKHIDFAAGLLILPDTKGGYVSITPTPEVLDMLQWRYQGQEDLLFPSPHGGGLLKKTGKPFLRAVALCELNKGISDAANKVVFHTLRHTYASWLAQNAVPMEVVREMMGHKDPRMTQRYAKLAPDNKRQAAAIISHILHGST